MPELADLEEEEVDLEVLVLEEEDLLLEEEEPEAMMGAEVRICGQ